MLKRNLLILFILFVSTAFYAQNPKPYKSYFGLNLMQNVSNGTEHFGIIRIYNNGDTERKILTRQCWMLQFAGHQESEANPDSINYFLRHEIDPRTLQNLWKIRYSDYPFKSQTQTTGWSNNSFSPSEAQMNYLKKYGFEHINSFIYGDKLVQLLKDMMSPEWVSNYSSLE